MVSEAFGAALTVGGAVVSDSPPPATLAVLSAGPDDASFAGFDVHILPLRFLTRRGIVASHVVARSRARAAPGVVTERAYPLLVRKLVGALRLGRCGGGAGLLVALLRAARSLLVRWRPVARLAAGDAAGGAEGAVLLLHQRRLLLDDELDDRGLRVRGVDGQVQNSWSKPAEFLCILLQHALLHRPHLVHQRVQRDGTCGVGHPAEGAPPAVRLYCLPELSCGIRSRSGPPVCVLSTILTWRAHLAGGKTASASRFGCLRRRLAPRGLVRTPPRKPAARPRPPRLAR